MTFTVLRYRACPGFRSVSAQWLRLGPPLAYSGLQSLCSHRQKRVRQIHKMMKRGLLDPETEDPFSLFVASTTIRYCYYHETHKILGNTFGMCVLQVRYPAALEQCY